MKPTHLPKAGTKAEESTATTRDKILDQAEELFAERGYHGVSLREIMKRCDVQLAAIAYYFKTKERLYRAVFERRAHELNRLRNTQLDRAIDGAGGGALSEEAVIESLVAPFLDRFVNGGPGWRNFCILISHSTIAPEWGELMSELFDDFARRIIEQLTKRNPGTNADTKAISAYLFMVGSMAVTFSLSGRLDRLSKGSYPSDDVRRIYSDLVPFLASGFRRLVALDSVAKPNSPRPVARATRVRKSITMRNRLP